MMVVILKVQKYLIDHIHIDIKTLNGNYVYGGIPHWNGRLERVNTKSIFTAAGSVTNSDSKTFTLVYQDDVYVSNYKYGIYKNIHDSLKMKLFGSPAWYSSYGTFIMQVNKLSNGKPVLVSDDGNSIAWNGSKWTMLEQGSEQGWYQMQTDPVWNQNFTLKFIKPENSAAQNQDLTFTPLSNFKQTGETVKGLQGALPIWI